MSITVPLAPIATFAAEHPWPTVALMFLIGVVLPAVWGSRERRHAAMAVIRAVLDTATAIAVTIRSGYRP